MKHSPRDIEVEVESLLLPAPNWKGGSCSGLFRRNKALVEYPLLLDNDGRRMTDFLRLRKGQLCISDGTRFWLTQVAWVLRGTQIVAVTTA